MERVVIIGGGLGGLTAGALLAGRGFSVTLLEKHRVVGGCATTFPRPGGFMCEASLHEMDSLYDDPIKREVFEELGLYDRLDFVSPEAFFAVQTQRGRFVMPKGVEAAKAALCERFPKESDAIVRYFALIEDLARTLRRLQYPRTLADRLAMPWRWGRLRRYAAISVQAMMDRLFRDEALKLVLNANIGYYHDAPSRLSFLLHAAAQYGYYRGSGWYIKGGSQRLSDALAAHITAHGGRVVTRAEVTGIAKERVTFRHKNETHTLPCDRIISNLSPADTCRLAGHLYKESREIGMSLFNVYLGFDKDLREIIPHNAYVTFFPPEGIRLRDIGGICRRPVAERGFSFVDYSRIDSGLTPQGRSVATLATYDRMSGWEGLSREAYRARKAQAVEAMLANLSHRYPGILDHLVFAEGATPLTIRRYIGTPEGTPYGFAPTTESYFRRRVRACLPNLHFVGQWAAGGGFTPAIQSGWQVCRALL